MTPDQGMIDLSQLLSTPEGPLFPPGLGDSGTVTGNLPTTKSKQIFRRIGIGSPRIGFEPTTHRLTADCSTAELPRKDADSFILHTFEERCFLEPPYHHCSKIQSISTSWALHTPHLLL
uniref:Uncharacterized protein n=1 Tax=Psilotum nudum TaxID=3240 RepID=Q8W7G6_PSINU|nr:hypothetical protein PsnuCp073 [Psilotum nudum]NP_569700.1 hypothetical protein PsnuCp095 [Psilotum nudum]BAB84267.1 hypothetical protein [Psilotum nudum]BAB84289.1 hypothetical protein [Psilotum nudum]